MQLFSKKCVRTVCMLTASLFLITLILSGCRLAPTPARKAAAPDYGPLKREVEKFTAATGATYGVFFKDIPSGATFGINADKPLKAASLNKLTTVFYLNRLVADGKLDMRNRVTYNKAEDFNPWGGILETEGIDGQSYSVRTLANLSITLSDNIAHDMLLRYLGKDKISEFMKSIGGKTVYPGGANVSTARDMGVYLQAVLDFTRKQPALGNRLLDDLENTIWDVGLPGRIPAKVLVAHKEGQITGVNNDAGVVFGNRPYILVVMSDGILNIDKGFANITTISRMVYDYQQKIGRR